MTMITPSYLGETIEYSSLHACRSTLEDPTLKLDRHTVFLALPLTETKIGVSNAASTARMAATIKSSVSVNALVARRTRGIHIVSKTSRKRQSFTNIAKTCTRIPGRDTGITLQRERPTLVSGANSGPI